MADVPTETGDWNERLDQLFRAPLKRFFLQRTRTESEAEDLVQDVFMRLLENPREHAPVRPNAYVFTVAVNMLRDRSRRARVAFLAGHRQMTDGVAEHVETAAEEPDAERVLVFRDELSRVSLALDELNERTRSIFLLCRVEGLAQKDVARRFSITVSAVEKHVSKALVHIGARLDR